MITVVGGSGFIGTRLCSRLSKNGLEFNLVDKRESTRFADVGSIGDVRNLQDLKAQLSRDAVVVNLAAEHRDDVRPKSLYDDVNVQGARNVCEACRENNINKIIFTSSVAVYGFAEVGTDESGAVNPFNDYGRTKAEAEQVYKAWQAEDAEGRVLVIIRPTVVFGEQNRGNVFNLLRQVALGRFVMVGKGTNRKSMAYVENVAAFIIHSLSFGPGVHTYNYIDKPDLTMNELIGKIRSVLGMGSGIGVRVPYWIGYPLARLVDILALIMRRSLPISSIRVKKFCSDTMFDTSVSDTGFVAPVSLEDGLLKTLKHEFIENHSSDEVFYSE